MKGEIKEKHAIFPKIVVEDCLPVSHNVQTKNHPSLKIVYCL